MDKRVKFSVKEKTSIVRAILAGRESTHSAAIKVGANKKSIQSWLSLYRHYGIAGLKGRPGTYSGKFKIRAITHMLKNHLSLIQTAAFFGIPSDHTLRYWFKIYQREGKTGLLQERRGRKRSIMSKKPKKPKHKSTGSTEEQLAALQSENEFLRAENAFLKKVEALIQEEKAAQEQNKRQKPSKN